MLKSKAALGFFLVLLVGAVLIAYALSKPRAVEAPKSPVFIEGQSAQ